LLEGPAEPRAGAQVSALAVWQGMQRRLCSQGAREEEGVGCEVRHDTRSAAQVCRRHQCTPAQHSLRGTGTRTQVKRPATTTHREAEGDDGDERTRVNASHRVCFRKNSKHEPEFAPVWDPFDPPIVLSTVDVLVVLVVRTVLRRSRTTSAPSPGRLFRRPGASPGPYQPQVPGAEFGLG
jgi:hypothetical protein